MDRTKRICNLLGMAQRAHCIASGRTAVEQAARNGTAKVLLVAGDAEEASRREYEELAKRCRIPCRIGLTREQLGACLGKEYRASAAILDDGFRASLERILDE